MTKTKRYAAGTGVSVANSKAEIEKVVRQYGGTSILTVSDDDRGRSGVQFGAIGRVVEIGFDHPSIDDPVITEKPSGRVRPRPERQGAIEDEIRRRWRCLLLTVKATFEVYQSGIADFDRVFLPYLVGPDGRTIADVVVPQVEAAYETGGISVVAGLSWGQTTKSPVEQLDGQTSIDEVLELGPGEVLAW